MVRPRGTLDLQSVSVLREALRAASGPARHVVVDLEDLHYIDSSGIRVLLLYAHLCRERGGGFLLARPRPSVRRVMEIVDPQKRLPVAPSVDDAVDAIAGRSAEGP